MAVRVAEACGHAVECGLRQLREQALALDGAERAGVLREEHVCGRVVALLGDRRRELGAVAVAHLDVDPGLLLEAVEERLDELLFAARVHDELLVRAWVVVATAARRDAEQRRNCQHRSPSARSLPPRLSGPPYKRRKPM